MKNIKFKKWFQENKTCLIEEYNNFKIEMANDSDEIVPFEHWAFDKFENLFDTHI